MTPACIRFGMFSIGPDDVRGKRVLEVGSYDVNGSLQAYVESMNPKELIGVDIKRGPGVTNKLDAKDLVKTYGRESFDLVYSTEMFEHVKNWRDVALNMMAVLKPGGLLVLTTRAPGFPEHCYPEDHWRYTSADLATIFGGGCDILGLVHDIDDMGTFMRARRSDGPIQEAPVDFRPHPVQ